MRELQSENQSEYADLHSHIEGTAWFEQISATLAEFGVDFSEETKKYVKSLEAQKKETVDLKTFISNLTTRWIRLGLMKIYKQAIEQGEKPKEAGKKYLKRLYTVVLADVESQGIRQLNLLYSPWNLGSDGDLSPEYMEGHPDSIAFPSKSLPQFGQTEEEDIYAWFKSDKAQKHASKFLTTDEYIDTVDEAINEYQADRTHRLQILKTVSFRRNNGPELDLIRNEITKDAVADKVLATTDEVGAQKIQATAEWMRDLFKAGKIDIVDLCGIETEENFQLVHYLLFFKKLQELGVPYSLHLGELPRDPNPEGQKAKIALDNIRTLVNNDLTPVVIAHGVRLFEAMADMQSTKGQSIREYIQKNKITTIICYSSNLATQTHSEDSGETHPVVKGLLELLEKTTKRVESSGGAGQIKPESMEQFLLLDILRIAIGIDDRTATSPNNSVDHILVEYQRVSKNLLGDLQLSPDSAEFQKLQNQVIHNLKVLSQVCYGLIVKDIETARDELYKKRE